MTKPTYKKDLLAAYPNISSEHLYKTLQIYAGINNRCNNHENYKGVINEFEIVEFYEFLIKNKYFIRAKKNKISVCRKADSGNYNLANCEIKTQRANFIEAKTRNNCFKIFFTDGTTYLTQNIKLLWDCIKSDWDFSQTTFYKRIRDNKPIDHSIVYKVVRVA